MTTTTGPTYAFDRFLRYDELTAWLHGIAAEHPDLVARVAAFRDRYVSLGRSPADDPLEVR